MGENRLRGLWRDDRPALGCWLTLPDPFAAEMLSRLGYDWLCIDMQHGLIDYQLALHMLQAISTSDAAPVVRVPWNDPAIIMKMLDAGAKGVIIPLIDTVADAEKAVAACRYPPLGRRSFGPTRAILYGGANYIEEANADVCCIPMIETASAMENLDEILSVPGVDAVYIGPMDLSLAMGVPPKVDGDEPEYVAARRKIADACRRHGVIAGIHCRAQTAPARVADGFRFVLVTSDGSALARAAEEEISAVRAKL